MSRPDAAPVRVYLCECGPILREALDLAALGHALAGAPGVEAVERQATLCSPEGQAWLGRELAAHPGCRPVVVACSPREHGRTFMDVCRRAGTNPYLLAIANVREQCAWVTREPARALEKAIALGRAAIARARLQQELEEQEIDCCPDALVLGAGVAGLTAALLLARADRRVVLVERAPAIGGRTVLLSELFPHLECASCALVPLMDEVLHHPNIEVLTSSQVERVLGSFGNFQVGIRRRARFVDPAACYGCGTCHAACPVEGPNEHQQGLGRRKAIYLPYAGALPNVSTLDAERCLRRTGQACDACQKACPFGAIDLQAQEAVLERRVGGIVVATGADTPLRGAAARMPRVITAAALERMLDPAGPTGGELRPAGLPPPRSVALVHCATADGRAPAPTCSKVCCQALAKYAHALRARLPDAKLTRLVWDECAGGKGAREFVRDAFRAPGVESVRLLPGERLEGLEERGDSVWLKLRRGRRLEVVQAELVVLATAMEGASQVEALAGRMRLGLDPAGFVVEENDRLASYRTRVEGIFVAGCAQGPKDVQESSAQAAGASGALLSALVPGRKLKLEPAVARVDPALCGGCRACVGACPFQAVRYDQERRAAQVTEVLCRGCGTCAAGCPAGAIQALHFTAEQLGGEISALLEG